MRIGIIGSMQKTEAMIDLRDRLIGLGHDAYLTALAEPFVGKSDEEKERIKIDQKMTMDAVREFWNLMQGGDAVLVTNVEKNGVENYIGANTFWEIGFAHVLGQRIFLLNPMPENAYLRTELEAVNPTVIFGDLGKIA